MKALKNLTLLLLLVLAFTGWRDKRSQLAPSLWPVYTPEYAFIFATYNVPVTVTNPWRDMSVKRRYGESGNSVRYLYGTLQRSGEIAKKVTKYFMKTI